VHHTAIVRSILLVFVHTWLVEILGMDSEAEYIVSKPNGHLSLHYCKFSKLSVTWLKNQLGEFVMQPAKF